MPGRTIRTYTIETRGASAILMSWGTDIAAGPVEVRQFKGIAEAKKAAETEAGRALTWREAQGEEKRHGVVAAADL